MGKPNFKDVKKLIKAINDTDNAFMSIYNDRQLQEKNIKTLCNKLAGIEARKALYDISVEELKKAKAGIRFQALLDANYRHGVLNLTIPKKALEKKIPEKNLIAIKG
ncbi:MAG: hypothetical protein IJU77_13885 [Butyrivibrio sp.]|nr:hypothetical protein [Butyrivibrio sp.]